ncbi:MULTISPECIES: DUF4244 domain-containing protein [unclassified Gordonia (in: high G+C Gram-positive bacteria)]|uniref:DUF4244 domain-containing protein n=1 Tax=unclassified Gordonia (in: high G+C Gram-positive bacteria) TaxID=2657482 RepID=UPI001F0CF2FF|nr:DUF4244 domain-containing protein [Gordonia sp. ABSL49_1]MCH5641678.1 DUF4244 domain-containing protein [Gordonia sp. ABSL49_1]
MSPLNTCRAAIDRINTHALQIITDEDGMSTAEYAIGTIAAAAFGAILYTVVTGDNIVSALTGIIGKALSTSVG